MTHADEALRARARELSDLCSTTWKPLVPDDRRVALLDIPNHNNPGDAAILLGELRILESLGRRADYLADLRSFKDAHLSRRAPGGIVLMHGGGNVGDTYPKHQAFREQFLSTHPRTDVVQLPQSVFFRDELNAQRAAGTYKTHPGVTFLARDSLAQQRLRDQLGIEAALCPDSAFSLVDETWLQTLPSRGSRDFVYLLRTDDERTRPEEDDQALGGKQDWGVGHFERRRFLPRLLSRAAPYLPEMAAPLSQLSPYDNVRLSRTLVRFAAERLVQGKVVVTDRLHAMILCMICGIPHVALDNRNGKVHAFHRDWLDGLPNSRRASSVVEAQDMAAELLRGSAV